MPLPHFRNLPQTGFGDQSKAQEIVYKSLFEIEFILPRILKEQGRDSSLFLLTASSVDLPLTPELEIITQRYKYSTRAYNGLPSQTHFDGLNIKFIVNVNERNSINIWNSLKAWYDLSWNAADGTVEYKRNLAGIINVNVHDKKQQVIRRVSYVNAMLYGITGWEGFDWESTNDKLELTASFRGDGWTDFYIDDRGGSGGGIRF